MKALTKRTAQPTKAVSTPQDLITSLLTGNFPTLEAETQFLPEVDISETKRSFEIRANVPGVDPKKINVEVNDTTLSLSGETEKEEREEGENFYRVERSSGSFYRSFELPNTADFDKIKCTAKNGVLSISIPKKEKSKGKKIAVKAE